MNGAGNKILVLDLRGASVRPAPEDARAIHRAPGLDYDQMMVVVDPRTAGTAADVLIFNNDGTLAGACGNGTRCVADRLCRELGVSAVKIETEAGIIACERLGPWSYRVDMGPPRLEWDAIPLARVRPRHAAGRPLAQWRRTCGARTRLGRQHGQSACGVLRRRTSSASMRRTSAQRSRSIRCSRKRPTSRSPRCRRATTCEARVWERGVGLTLACGSAACATLVAASRLGLMERKGTVRLPGGELVIEWRAADDHVLMTGPVEFEGAFVLDDALLEAAAP